MSGSSAWGEERTSFFFELTPERVLEAVEATGLRCTGRCSALNSFENRVYDVELEAPEVEGDAAPSAAAAHPSARRRIVKFYRPGRWTEEQILEEHQFLADLQAAEIPAVAPLEFPDGGTLRKTREGSIFYAVFPKIGGRAPDELSDDQLLRIGRLLARVHNVGAQREAPHRVRLDAESYGRANLEYLLAHGHVPLDYRARYETVVRALCERSAALLDGVPIQRVHGDCHLGNLLWSVDGPFFVDFDDMVRAPVMQDVWLLVPGRDEESRAQRELLLEGYAEMRAFDCSQLALIEPLRALRIVHYSAWVARRWQDPAFPRAFPQFESHRYWADEMAALEECLYRIENPS